MQGDYKKQQFHNGNNNSFFLDCSHSLKKEYKMKKILFISSLCLITSSTQADIGLGIDVKSSEYKGVDSIANLHLEYQGEKLNINKDSIAYTLKENDRVRFEVLGVAEQRGYEENFSNTLKGMDDRDASLNLGGRITGKTKYGELSFSTTTDISNRHNGQEADLRFGQNPYQTHWTGKRELNIGMLAGVKWQSDDVVDYYYGVKNSETTAERAAYEGKSAITPYLGLQANVNFTKNLSLKAEAVYKSLPSKITDSPIVDDNNIELSTRLTYWF